MIALVKTGIKNAGLVYKSIYGSPPSKFDPCGMKITRGAVSTSSGGSIGISIFSLGGGASKSRGAETV